MSNLFFEYPIILLLLPITFICLKICPQKDDALLFSNTKLLSKSYKRLSLVNIFKILTLFFTILALASPYDLKKYEKNIQSMHISLIIDVSLSMKEDFTTLQKILDNFLPKDSINLFSSIFFADSVYIASPPTHDINFIKLSLKKISPGDLGEYETHLYDAIYLGNHLLKKCDANSSMAIVLTDGKDKGSKIKLNELFQDLENNKSKFYIIGFKDEYDKTILNEIAKITGGKLLEAKNVDDIKKIFLDLKKRYNSKDEKIEKIIKTPLYQIPLFLAFLSLLFYTYFINKRAIV